MNKQYSLISKILAIALTSLGVIVFIGWLFDISILKSVVPGVVSMKVNTALCFILSGFTLWILNEEKQNSLKKMCSIVFPSIMILIGLLTLGEYLFEINFGIDEFLFKEETRATATSDPGRMSPITAFCFILSGISLMLLYKNKAFQMFQLLSLAVFALALLTLIGYGYAVNDFQGGMASFTKMAIHTSVAFVFLSVGILFSKSDKGIMYIFTNDGIAGITTRKLLPVIIFTPLILGWLRLIGQQAGYYDTEFGVALFSFTTILILVVVVFGISGTLLAIDRKRKEAEEQLNEYRHFFNINHDLCGIANTEGYFEFINANFAKILGYTEKEFCETAFIELIHPDDIPATVQEYEKLKSGALVINFVNRYRKKDGSYLYLDWNATPNPATQKLYCVARDISERKKAEEELLKLQQDYERIFNTVSEGIHGIDNDGNIIFENPAAANMLGWNVNELIGKPAHSTMHHSHADGSVYPKTQCKIYATLHDGILRYVADEVFWRKDGSSFPVAYTSSPMLNKKGEIIGSIVTFRDITKQKNAEKALQNSEEKFRNLINFSPVGITLSSQQGEILETNQTIIDMMGFESKEEFLNTPASELYVDQNGRTQLVELFKKDGIVKNFEVRLKRKNGEVIWCSSHIHPFKLPGGEIALLSTTLDISERKKAEEMLELTQFAVDNFGDAIFWITPDARIFKVNEAACSMLGYDQAELLQFSIPDIDPNYNAELWPNHFAELRQKGSLIFETYQQGKDGQLIPVEVRANYINFDNKEFNCASVRDITKRKKAEGELQAVNIELESFSYSVSHDLRAPLRAINGFAKILYEDYASKLDAEGIGMLNIIRDNSKKMGELIDALLAFSKLGRREISVSEINMTELVATVREEEMRGQSDKTEFIINELPAATGDIVLIKQVWINLVSNAIKYSQHIPKARIEIGSYYKDNLIVYYVKDNGAGFDMQYYDKLFGVFQRLHSQDEFKGTGIGLSIAEKVINRHGGSVWAESKLNEGSCFYFSLPTTNL